MNKLKDENILFKIQFSLLSQNVSYSIIWKRKDRLIDHLALLHETVIYLEIGLFFNAGIDDNMSFPRYRQIRNSKEHRTLTRWS